jgi:hypothetical protein
LVFQLQRIRHFPRPVSAATGRKWLHCDALHHGAIQCNAKCITYVIKRCNVRNAAVFATVLEG